MGKLMARLHDMTDQPFMVPSPRAGCLAFLMSGVPEVRTAVTALEAKGYVVAVVLGFDADSDWVSLPWLSVQGNDRPDLIVKAVLDIDSGAIRL